MAAWAQPSLPPCPSDVRAYWHNCIGTYPLPDGNKFVGEFKDDKANGQGTSTFANGNKHVGEYKDGQYNGQGAFTFANGEKFVGEFKAGKVDGEGTYTFANGDKYVGEWRGNLRNGQGIEYRADGTIVNSGQWADGKLVNSYALDRNRFPFDEATQIATPALDTVRTETSRPAGVAGGHSGINRIPDYPVPAEPVRTERDRLAAEAEAARRRQQDLEQRLATEARERERQAVEAEAARRKQQELEQQLAAQGEEARRQQQQLQQQLAQEARERERLTAEGRERDRLAAEVDAIRRQQQQLQQQLAAAQNQSSPVPPPPMMATPRNAHALVIGNAAYSGSGRLDNPVNDASAISQKLRSMGFTVTTVTDANRQRLVQAMAQFRRSAASADLSLLFYSGHGVQIFGTNYILPIDVDQTDVAQATIQGVRLNEVVENFMPGKTKLVFLDACRDNPLQRTGDRSVSKGLAPISVAQGTLISYATKDGQVALDGVGQKNSPFTQALLEHIADPQDIGVVLRKVREKVMQATGGKQQPWEYGSLTGGELVLSAIRGVRR
jgi:hypothetical protein